MGLTKKGLRWAAPHFLVPTQVLLTPAVGCSALHVWASRKNGCSGSIQILRPAGSAPLTMKWGPTFHSSFPPGQMLLRPAPLRWPWPACRSESRSPPSNSFLSLQRTLRSRTKSQGHCPGQVGKQDVGFLQLPLPFPSPSGAVLGVTALHLMETRELSISSQRQEVGGRWEWLTGLPLAFCTMNPAEDVLRASLYPNDKSGLAPYGLRS